MRFNFILNLTLLAIIVSCGQQKQTYLYSKGDDGYQAQLNLAVDRCIAESKTLSKMDKYFSFDNIIKKGFDKSKVYLISERRDNRNFGELYIYITEIIAERMVVNFRGNGESFALYNGKQVVITGDDNKKIMKEIAKGVCRNTDGYAHTSLDNEALLEFTSTRNTLAEGTERVLVSTVEKFSVDMSQDVAYPLFIPLIKTNGTIQNHEALVAEAAPAPERFFRTMSSVSLEVCRSRVNCVGIDTDYSAGQLEIFENHYQARGVEDRLISVR